MAKDDKPEKFDPAEFTEEAQHDLSLLDSLSEKQARKLDEYLQESDSTAAIHIRGKVAHIVNAYNVESNN